MQKSDQEQSILQIMVDAEMLDRARMEHEAYVSTLGRRERVRRLRFWAAQ